MTIDPGMFNPARQLFATINFACENGRMPSAIDDLSAYMVKHHGEAITHQIGKPFAAINNFISGEKKDFSWLNEGNILELLGKLEAVLIQTGQNLDNEISTIRAQDTNQNSHALQMMNLIQSRQAHEETLRTISERLAQRNQVLERLQANAGIGVLAHAGTLALGTRHQSVEDAQRNLADIRREMNNETAAIRSIENQMRAIDGKYEQSATYQRLSALEGVRAQIRTILDDSPENPRSIYQVRNGLETIRTLDILTTERDRFREIRDKAQNRVTELELIRGDTQNEIDAARRKLQRMELEQSGQSTEGLVLGNAQDNKYTLPETLEALRDYLGVPSAPPLYRNTGLYLKMEVAEHNLNVAREDFTRATAQLEGATDKVNTFYERRAEYYNRSLDLLLQFTDHRMAAPAYHENWLSNNLGNLHHHFGQFVGASKASDVSVDRTPVLREWNNKLGQTGQAERKIGIHSTNTDLHRSVYSPFFNGVLPIITGAVTGGIAPALGASSMGAPIVDGVFAGGAVAGVLNTADVTSDPDHSFLRRLAWPMAKAGALAGGALAATAATAAAPAVGAVGTIGWTGYSIKRILDKADDRIKAGCFEQAEATQNIMQLRDVVNQEYKAAIQQQNGVKL